MEVSCVTLKRRQSEGMKLSQYAKPDGIQYRAAYNRFKAGKFDGAYQNEHSRIDIPDPYSKFIFDERKCML